MGDSGQQDPFHYEKKEKAIQSILLATTDVLYIHVTLEARSYRSLGVYNGIEVR